jgi:hypothetical protein
MKYCCAITRKILIHVIKVENCWKNCKARVSFGNAATSEILHIAQPGKGEQTA